MQADIEEKIYKPIFLEVGLMNAICGLNWNNISQMAETTLVNEGAIAEQFIGQHLLELLADSPNRELNYWLRGKGPARHVLLIWLGCANYKKLPR